MEIKPYSKNAKKHPKSQLLALAKVVAEVGWRQNVEVNQKGVIVAGHGRYLTWQTYKDEYKLPDIWVTDDTGKTIFGEHDTRPLTEEQEIMWRLADNKLNESDWDMELALEDLKLLSDGMFDLTGFDKDLLIEPESKDDDVPELPEEPQSKEGDVYELGYHRVVCGDSTKAEDIAILMQNNKADLVVTDPPYNVAYEGSTGLTIENDSMSDNSFLIFLTEAFSRMSESMKLGATFYIWHADSEGFNFRKASKDAGLTVKQCIIWNKNSLVMGRQDYQWKHEPCLYGWRDGASHTWYGDRDKTTVLKVPADETKAFEWFKKELKRQETNNTSVLEYNKPRKNGVHPTMKPIELLTKQIVNSSKQEDVVLDTFLGSGSTLIASEKTGRVCYGMELDPKYVDVIVQRYVDYTGNEYITKNGLPIEWKKK